MRFDLIIRNGRVIDGTGLKGYSADIAIKDGRIARIGRVDDSAEREYDAAGLVVCPGFIDIHTHYDVQLDWDPIATPSAWHGVTTVMAGNCGFTLAPAKPDDVGWLARMLSRVEGMSPAALSEGLRFEGGSFGDFWNRFEGKIGVNVGAYVGHSAVRRFVMGDDASEREATKEEIEAMKELVRQAMHEGAIGFSTSQLDIHIGDDGRGVPSNHATPEEVVELASVLSEFDHGAVEIIPHSFAAGYDDADRKLLVDLYKASGKPVELNPLIPSTTHPMGWEATLNFVSEMAEQGIRLHPMCSVNKLEAHLRLSDTFIFDESPAKEREISSFDCFLDLSLSENLEMNFYSEMDEAAVEFMRHVNRTAVLNPMVMAGSSDGGAHLATFVGADYTTRLLSEYVPDPLSLEEAIYRLTGMPANVHGLVDRGTLRVGAKADIVCFDAGALKASRAYLVEDFPADSSRYVVDSEGYKLTVVNGQILVEDGEHTGALPGEVLHGA